MPGELSIFSAQRTPQLGDSFRSLSGEVRASPIDPAADQTNIKRTAEWNKITLIESESSLRTELEIHFSASYKSLGIGGNGIQGSLDFYRSTNYTSYCVWLCARVGRIKGGRQFVGVPPLTQEARAVLKVGKWGAFYQKYGDRFVSQVIYGGELLILFSIQCTTAAEYQAVRATVGANCGSFEGALDVQQRIDSIAKSQRIELRTYASGYDGPLPTLRSGFDASEKKAALDALLTLIAQFPINVDHSVDSISHFATGEANELSGWPVALRPDITPGRHALETVTPLRDRASELQGDLAFVLQSPELFAPFDRVALKKDAAALALYCRNLDLYAENAFTEPWNKKELMDPPTYDLDGLESELPARFTLTRPVIHMTFRHWGMQDQEPNLDGVTNLVDNPGGPAFIGWAGDPDHQRQLSYVSFALSPPVAGLKLEYLVEYKDGGGSAGWAQEGAVYDLRPSQTTLKALAFRLVGPLAQFYSVEYWIRVIHSQTVGPTSAPGLAHNNDDPISGVFILAKPNTSADALTTRARPANVWRALEGSIEEFIGGRKGAGPASGRPRV